MPTFDRVTPILSVRDLDASIAYYMEKLGFTSSWQWDETFGGVRRDALDIYFCKGCQGSPGTWMSIWVDDVDALHRELMERGADIRQPPTNFAWGVREMNVCDPDGHRLRISMQGHQPGESVLSAVTK